MKGRGERNVFLVSYDIRDARRLREVYKTMRGWGDHIQYSVFRCDLSPRERAEMIAALDVVIDHRHDQVLIVDLGPVDGRAAECVQALGQPYRPPERRVLIV